MFKFTISLSLLATVLDSEQIFFNFPLDSFQFVQNKWEHKYKKTFLLQLDQCERLCVFVCVFVTCFSLIN